MTETTSVEDLPLAESLGQKSYLLYFYRYMNLEQYISNCGESWNNIADKRLLIVDASEQFLFMYPYALRSHQW